MFEEFMEAISYLEVPVIAGLIPLKSLGMAEFMNRNISGVNVPEEIMFRIKDSPDPVEEGLSIASETIKELMKLSRGVHIMPVGSHNNTSRLLSMAGLSGK
jgi:5,10-methylenetetrahydrofolate reductase